MTNNSRTSLSIKNAQIALFFYIINLILRFFSRKVFLDYLGTEILGLNTTAQNLLGFLNIAELGVGAATASALYSPIYKNEYPIINEIVSIQGWLYKNIALIVLFGAIIMMCFFPFIFDKTNLPLWYAFCSFSAFLYSSLLGYFVNYKQIIFSADQKEYKNTINLQGWGFIKVLLQILAIQNLSNGFIYWVIIEVLITTVASITLNRSLHNCYPWLKTSIKKGKRSHKNYPDLVKKIKQIFFHKLAGFALTQTSPIIIYAYSSLTTVALYGNYIIITSGITMLMQAILNSLNASVGNLVAENNIEKIKSVFWDITIIRTFIAATICFTTYICAGPFISIWIGERYILDNYSFIILLLNTFILLTRTNDVFIAAYGMFQDIAAPVIEAILNIGCSILFGYFWGLPGILFGVFISQFAIVVCWKSFFLFRYGFKQNIIEYIKFYVKHISLLFISCIISIKLISLMPYPNKNILDLIYFTILVSLCYIIISIILLAIFDLKARKVIHKLFSILNNIIK